MGFSLKSFNPVKIVSTIINPAQSLVNSVVGIVSKPVGDALDIANVVQGTVGGLVGAGVLAAGAAAGGAAGAAGGAAGAGASASAAESSAAAAASSLSILSSIKDGISATKDFLGGVIGPISDTIHSVTDVVKDVNENLIKPIVAPIKSIMDNYAALQGALTRDLHDGIGGLLRIPNDIGNALTSIDATMQRTVATLGAANEDVIKRNLGPGVGAGVLEGASGAGAKLSEGLDQYGKDERDSFIGKLTDDPSEEDIAAIESKIARAIDENAPWIGKIGGVLLDVATSLTLVFSYIESKHERYRQIGARKWPTAELDAATAVQAWRRQIIDEEALKHELGGHGFNEQRMELLKELARVQPSADDVLSWCERGFIDQREATDALRVLGWREDDANRLREGHKRLPDATTAIRWRRRGFIGEEELDALLAAAGARDVDRERLKQDEIRQLGAGDVLSYIDRSGLVAANIAPKSLNAQPPPEVLESLAPLGIDARGAAVLWSNHFATLAAPDAVQAWFRGYISLDMLHAVLRSTGLVEEQWQNYIDLQRPLFTVRNVPTLLGAGILNQAQAMDILLKNGYEQVDADRMVRFALGKKKPDTTASADQLHGLTTAAVTQLYDAGAIDREQATVLLKHLDLGEEAAQLTLTLRDVKRQAEERASEADIVIAEARAGLHTFQEAEAALHQLGLSSTETSRALTDLTHSLTARTKLPSEAQIVGMFKHGLLSRAAAAQTLGLVGYSDAWAELLIQLAEGEQHASTANQ